MSDMVPLIHDQQQSLSPISQAPQMDVSTKRHSICQEKEAAKKQKLETTKGAESEDDEKQQVETNKAENEVDEKLQVESTKAEKEVAEKQKVESTEDEKEISYDSDDASDDASDDSYEVLVKSYDGPDWQQKLFPVSSPEPEDGERRLPFRSISVVGFREGGRFVRGSVVSSEGLALHEKEKLEADIDSAVATDERLKKKGKNSSY